MAPRSACDVAMSADVTGFDPDGRDHFNGKLKGSRRWIGTTGECLALQNELCCLGLGPEQLRPVQLPELIGLQRSTSR